MTRWCMTETSKRIKTTRMGLLLKTMTNGGCTLEIHKKNSEESLNWEKRNPTASRGWSFVFCSFCVRVYLHYAEVETSFFPCPCRYRVFEYSRLRLHSLAGSRTEVVND